MIGGKTMRAWYDRQSQQQKQLKHSDLLSWRGIRPLKVGTTDSLRNDTASQACRECRRDAPHGHVKTTYMLTFTDIKTQSTLSKCASMEK